MMPPVAVDERHCEDLIKKLLLRDDPTSATALRFASLSSRLTKLNALKRKWAIMYFLLSISQSKNDAETLLFETSFVTLFHDTSFKLILH